jgi:hypothetical protein
MIFGGLQLSTTHRRQGRDEAGFVVVVLSIAR